jgi:fatty-acid peroxygenase
MPSIPRDGPLDRSLAFLAEGYDYIGNRCRRFGSDIFETRLLGRRVYCMRGAEAARMFYEPGRMTRNGALPNATLKLLQDDGSVATLDDEAHRRRKAMFMALMTPGRLAEIARLSADGLRARAAASPAGERVVLHEAFREILLRAVCAWSGVPLSDERARSLTREVGAMIDYAGTLGPKNWRARLQRRRSERFLACVAADVRAGRIAPPPQSAAHAVAHYRDTNGRPLDEDLCAVELLNVIRPTVAIARFMTYAALALHENPQSRARLAVDDAYLRAFVQEVRRLYPFFPVVAGIARADFDWRGARFEAGGRFVLDLHGTDHDERLWEEPNASRPERFLGWEGDAFTMVPQGGGDHYADHRCAGEWLTIEVMVAMLRTLARDVSYDVPDQDLSIDLRDIPALPRSGFVVTNLKGR